MGKWKKDRSKFDGFEIQTNAYPKDEKLFIPYREEGVEYHFVDYYDREEHRWVRTPFQTIDDIINILQYIKKRGGRGIGELRILPECYLSDLHHSWDEKTQRMYSDNFTNRSALFGKSEDMFAEKFNEVRSLSQNQMSLVFDDLNETREEWKERVKETRSIRQDFKYDNFQDD